MQRITSLLVLMLLILTFIPVQAQQDCDPAIDHVVAGKAYQANGSLSAALNSFNCALALKPEGTAAILNLRGNVYRQSGDLQLALADYNQAITLADDQPIVFNNRGWTLYLLHDYDAALVDLNHALELDPALAYAYNNRGLVHQKKGHYQEASRDFLQAIALNHEPLDWPQYNLDQMVTSIGALSGSVSIEADVTPPDETLFAAGASAYFEGRYDEAIENFSEIIEHFPNSSYLCCSYLYRGYSYLEMGEIELAVADFDSVVEREPDEPGSYLNRGSGYAALGETVKAAEDFYTYATLNSTETVDSGALELMEAVTVEMTQGKRFAFTFEAEAGQQISVEARDVVDSQIVDALIVVTDSADQPLIADDDSGGNVDSYLVFTAPEAGTYQLIVHHAAGGSEGDVIVMICTPSAQV